jgi:hypothetical protein
MRLCAVLVGVTCAAILLSSVANAQTTQSVGTVTAAEVIVRAAPKDDAADAGQLFRGMNLIVHHAEGDDWLAIQPPAGAISWINHKFIAISKEKAFPQNAVVNAEGEVKIAAGKPGVNQPLNARKTGLPDGTIVTVIGAGVKTDDDQSIWYPIVAPRDDFRYVPRKALNIGGAPIDSFSVKAPVKVASATESMPLSISNKPVQYPNKPAGWPTSNSLWMRAERAEQANDYKTAEELYFQLAKEMNAAGGDTDLANLCYTRIHAMRESRRQTATPAAASTKDAPAAWSPTKGETKISDPKNDGWTRREEAATKAQWTGSGFLRVAAMRSNGKQYYALEDGKGAVRYYVVSGKTEIDLDKYVRKTVDLFGTIEYPTDLKSGIVTVTWVDVLK